MANINVTVDTSILKQHLQDMEDHYKKWELYIEYKNRERRKLLRIYSGILTLWSAAAGLTFVILLDLPFGALTVWPGYFLILRIYRKRKNELEETFETFEALETL
jgi:hypothetical protein